MVEREFVVILSDIHIGTMAPTVWYRKEVHEKYLITILNDIINYANQIREVILLGDIFEFWAYPPGEIPPSIDDIIAENSNILGPKGKLCQMLSELRGRIIYIPGDHDMNVAQSDLNHIKSAEGYTIKYHSGAYIPNYDTHIIFAHGHEFTLLNASYYGSKLAPLPIGYFVTRAISYKVQNILNKTPGRTITALSEYGANASYGPNDFLTKLPIYLKNYVNESNVISKYIDEIADATGMPKDLQIRVNKSTTVSLNELKKIYINEDFNRTYFPFYMNHNNFGDFINTVVMGHTHLPFMTCNNDKMNYVNTGFMCPSNPHLGTPITYGIYNLSNHNVSLMKVTGNTPDSIQPYMSANTRSPFSYSPIKYEDKNLSQLLVNKYESQSNGGNYNITIEEYKLQAERNNKMGFILYNKLENDSKDITTKIEIKENVKISAQKLTFGWSVFNASLEFWKEMQDGVLSKANEYGIDVITHDEKSNTIEMIIGSLDLLSKGIDALIIAPFNPELLPAIVANAQKYQVPVVAIDTGTGGADVVAFIVSDSFGGGVYAGEYALTLIKKYDIKSKNIAIIKVQKTAPYALLRGEGFKSVMLAEGYTVVAEETANSEESQAYEVMKQILATYADDLAVVFSENGTMSLGAARAIDEAGKKGIIMLIGFDATPSELVAIKNGSMQGTIAQQPFKMGEIGVEVANEKLLGLPIIYDDPSRKLILMEVYLVDEKGEIKENIL